MSHIVAIFIEMRAFLHKFCVEFRFVFWKARIFFMHGMLCKLQCTSSCTPHFYAIFHNPETNTSSLYILFFAFMWFRWLGLIKQSIVSSQRINFRCICNLICIVYSFSRVYTVTICICVQIYILPTSKDLQKVSCSFFFVYS